MMVLATVHFLFMKDVRDVDSATRKGQGRAAMLEGKS